MRRDELEGAVGPLGVVVVDVDADDVFDVAAIQDQKPIETLGPDRSYEPFRDRVRSWCPDRCLHDPDALAAEHFVERARVLAVAVTDQDPCPLEQPGEAQVPSLLRDPVAVRVGRAAGEPDPAGRVFDEEQDVLAAEKQCLDREEVARDDARRLRMEELAPTRTLTTRRRAQPCCGEQAPDGCRRHDNAQLGELSADPPMTPARVLTG